MSHIDIYIYYQDVCLLLGSPSPQLVQLIDPNYARQSIEYFVFKCQRCLGQTKHARNKRRILITNVSAMMITPNIVFIWKYKVH